MHSRSRCKTWIWRLRKLHLPLTQNWHFVSFDLLILLENRQSLLPRASSEPLSFSPSRGFISYDHKTNAQKKKKKKKRKQNTINQISLGWPVSKPEPQMLACWRTHAAVQADEEVFVVGGTAALWLWRQKFFRFASLRDAWDNDDESDSNCS